MNEKTSGINARPTDLNSMKNTLKKLFLFLILPSLAFWLGMVAQAWIYEDWCMDLGGGRNHPDVGVSLPVCVLDMETYRQRYGR